LDAGAEKKRGVKEREMVKADLAAVRGEVGDVCQKKNL
jgi:hypothetical protein